MNFSIPILMYHQVSREPHPKFQKYSVTPKIFSAQMKLLKLFGYTSINLNNYIECRKGQINLPSKPIIITFDDGLQESIDNSVPILEEYGFSAVYYIPTNYVGKTSSWLAPELGIEFPIISWQTIKILDTNGFQIGGHSMTHPHLANLSEEQCYSELLGSRKNIEDRLGHEVLHMSYPYGSFDKRVLTIVAKSGYHTACSVMPGIVSLKNDPYLLPRITIKGNESLFDFIFKLHTAHTLTKFVHHKVRGVGRLFKRMFT